jgi:DNA-binding NtrC family response regulator/signal transduction histidine kinase
MEHVSANKSPSAKRYEREDSHTHGRFTGFRARLILVALSFCAYVISFFLISEIYGKGGATAAVVLVATAGWLFGFWPGIATALLALPLNFLLYTLVGTGRSELIEGGGIAGTTALLLIGAALGRLRDLGRRLTAELAEHKRTEEALRASRDQLENLIASSLDPIVIIDNQAVLQKANPAFLEMIGYSEQEVIGKLIHGFAPPPAGSYDATPGEQIIIDSQELEKQTRSMTATLMREGKLLNGSTYLLAKNRKIVPVTANIVLLFNQAGDRVGSCAIIRDITAQRKAEIELIASREAAVQANQFRSRFFTNITHEFRTPLTLAIGPLEGMLRGEFGPLEADMQEQVSVALRNSRQLLKLVNQLLDFSMAESGSAKLFWEKKDLGTINSAVLDAFSQIAAKKKISAVIDTEASLPAVAIDAPSYEKALFNLIGNAFRFTPEGGTVTVGLSRAPAGIPEDETMVTRAVAQPVSADTHIRLCIRDTGIGIRPEHLTTVFERFKQSGENLAFERGGSGIGLAHTRELIESMHGTITLKSTPGSGSQFCVYLPFEQMDPGQDAPDAAEMPAQEFPLNPDVETAELQSGEQGMLRGITGSRPLLLIVDDNRDVLRYIAGIVRNEYDYVCAENGREALRLLEQHVPELIISDIMMPHMDGYELLRRLKSNGRWRTTPFIFLTAKADVDMRIEGLEAGADDYISKPFNTLELLARVRSVLRLQDLQRQTDRQKQEIVELTRRLNSTNMYGSIVGSSPAMRAVYQVLENIKHSDAHVLISGETGTGKELVARSIHDNSRRSQGPFIAVNCSAIPAELMEREFFGHVKGAFTGAVSESRGFFEAADGGTLFLDEIGEMRLDMQVKLLRVLEHGEFMRVGSSAVSKVDARIIVATNKDLKEEVLSGKFREDLYFRIHIIPIHLPPLRKRRDDIPLLIEYFVDAYAKRHGAEATGLSREDMAFFLNYSYPGNVRELQNMLERVLLMGGGAEKLNTVTHAAPLPSSDFSGDIAGLLDSQYPLRDARANFERDIIIKVLELYKNNHTQAAEALKISRAALYKKIKRYGVKSGQV